MNKKSKETKKSSENAALSDSPGHGVGGNLQAQDLNKSEKHLHKPHVRIHIQAMC